MPSLTIKNIPEDLYERLKASATLHRRSINSEVILTIERSVGAAPVPPETLIARARALRETITGEPLSAEAIQDAKESGRP
ncbi:Arc family DNA-binding protein [Chloroflexota bacterium]